MSGSPGARSARPAAAGFTRRRSLLAALTIGLATLLLGALPAGAEPPHRAAYETKMPGFQLRLTVRGHRIVAIHRHVVVRCNDGGLSPDSFNSKHFDLPFDADGRFRYRHLSSLESFRIERLAGRVGRRAIVGSFYEASEFNPSRYRSRFRATGRPGDRVLHFVAHRVS